MRLHEFYFIWTFVINMIIIFKDVYTLKTISPLIHC